MIVHGVELPEGCEITVKYTSDGHVRVLGAYREHWLGHTTTPGEWAVAMANPEEYLRTIVAFVVGRLVSDAWVTQLPRESLATDVSR